MHKVSVSSLHLCHRCPRLLAYESRGAREAWRVGLSGSGTLPGSLFHDAIAAPFHQAMASGNGPLFYQLVTLVSGPLGRLEPGLQGAVESRFFLPVMARHAQALTEEQITQLKSGCERWVRQLAGFVGQAVSHGQGTPETLVRAVFHPPEARLRTTVVLSSNANVQVTGQYDALLLDLAGGEAVLFEFKGRKASQADEDFVQLALYAWLLKEATGITARGVVLYLEEDPPEVAYSAADLASAVPGFPALVEQAIEVSGAARANDGRHLLATADPSLCRACPYDGHCDRDWGDRRHPAGRTLTEADDAAEEAKGRMKALVETLSSLRLPVRPDGYIAGPRFIRLKLVPHLEKGVTVRRLYTQAENLQVALHLTSPPLIQAQAGHVSVDIPRRTRLPLTLGDVSRQGRRNRPASKVAFPMGMAIDGTIVWADLSDSTMTSILVGGTAGSGKSMFLRAAIIGLCVSATPAELQCLLIDPKRVSFNDLADLPHLCAPILMDHAPVLDCLGSLVEEMERRYRLFERHRVHDIYAYQRLGETLAHQVLVIDEYADLMVDKKAREGLETAIVRLAQKGRAAGMHLILATQRPDARIVTPLIKANLQLKVALKVTTTTNSKVILDDSGAECLIGNGDMLIGGSVPLQRVQGPLVSKSEIEEAMGKNITPASS